jgi:hypothetical protein
MSTELTTAEADSLAEHEAVIERGIKTFYEVGVALAEIRDQRLYRQSHDNFEDYCQERWGFNRHRAWQLISAAGVVTNVTTEGLPAPANEGQARELARVPEDLRAEVWQQTLNRTGGKPTAAAIRDTYAPTPPPIVPNRDVPAPPVVLDDEWDDEDEEDLPPLLPDGPRYCKYCYGEHELAYGPDCSIIVCTNCGSGLAPVDRAREAGGFDAFIEQITEQFHAYNRAVADFPELTYYNTQPRKAIALADNLRQFAEPELTMRRENLAKAITAEQREAAQPKAPPEPDYGALAHGMFLALNEAAQAVSRSGGAETFRRALPGANPLMVETWREQCSDLARMCSEIADECAPRLRRLK